MAHSAKVKQIPAFYKILGKDMSWLQIPPAFVELYAQRIAQKATVKGHDGILHEMEIWGTSNSSIGFREGWKSFAMTHELKPGDLVVMKLVEHSVFSVEMFDKKTVMNKQPYLFSEEESDVEQAANEQQPSRKRKLNAPNNPPKKKPTTEANRKPEKAKVDRPGDYISTRRAVTDAERKRALEAAERFSSKSPYSIAVMMESQVYRSFWMGLKRDFARKHMPCRNGEVTLIDENGDSWQARWKGGRTSGGISGGWRKFTLDHKLEEGDVCIFELIDKRNMKIKIHIFRVVETK